MDVFCSLPTVPLCENVDGILITHGDAVVVVHIAFYIEPTGGEV